MKNIFKATSIVFLAFYASSSFAKTEGSQIGVSLHRAKTEHKYIDPTANPNIGPQAKFRGKTNGFGVDYKYAVNFGEKFFIAPGVFYETLDTNVEDRSGDRNSFSFKNRFGAKVDLGYDVNERLAVYFTNGVSHVRYKMDIQDSDANGTTATFKEGVSDYFYGLGVTSRIAENVLIGAEYNTQTTRTRGFYDDMGVIPGHDVKNKIDLYKITASYIF